MDRKKNHIYIKLFVYVQYRKVLTANTIYKIG
jgi:hypothetical protein